MKRPILLWRFIATLCLLLTLCCSFVAHAAPYGEPAKDLGGFTPNPEVTLAFAKSRYPVGSTQKAEVSITGPTNGTYSIDITNVATGSSVASISLQIGGAPGSNKGSVNVILPSTTGDVTYRATFQTATDDATVTGVGVSKIQYKRGSSYVDADSLIYVLKGSSVEFKAVPSSIGDWPTNKPIWGGNASGTSPTTVVPFNTVSTSGFSPFTISVECGNTIPVQVIVYDLAIKSKPSDDFDQRSQERFGVGEDVKFSVGVTPSSVQLSVTLGTTMFYEFTTRQSGASITNEVDGTADYTAGPVAGSDTIQVRLLDGPSAGQKRSISKTVVTPDATSYIKQIMYATPQPSKTHQVNTWSVGFMGAIYLGPKDVSFSNIGFAEGAGTSVADNWLAPEFNGLPHPNKALDNEFHTVGKGNINTGSQVLIGKDVNGNNVLGFEIGDTIGGGSYPRIAAPHYGVGTLTWPINWHYKHMDSGNISGTVFTTVNHAMTSDANGKATVTKAGSATVEADATEATVSTPHWPSTGSNLFPFFAQR